jgi:hypothetical protein
MGRKHVFLTPLQDPPEDTCHVWTPSCLRRRSGRHPGGTQIDSVELAPPSSGTLDLKQRDRQGPGRSRTGSTLCQASKADFARDLSRKTDGRDQKVKGNSGARGNKTMDVLAGRSSEKMPPASDMSLAFLEVRVSERFRKTNAHRGWTTQRTTVVTKSPHRWQRCSA